MSTRDYFIRQAATLFRLAKAINNPALSAELLVKAADLEERSIEAQQAAPLNTRTFLDQRRSGMRRFFFDLQGRQYTPDQQGLPFKSELDAFQAAKKLASELAQTRPELRGNTCVVVRRYSLDDGYFISI